MDAALLNRIVAASENLHRSGTFSMQILRILAQHLSAHEIQHSVETGAGASTLLFSHLSPNHTVFAIDRGNSISSVMSSGLLNSASTRFVEGPTQKTMPCYAFNHKLQAVLLDGPHGFPFPNLEYYYIYPHLEENALLIIDDIHIRSIHDLFIFLKNDEMFKLIQIAGVTAFFRRTSAPTFDPLGDEWWLQGYNRQVLRRAVWRERLHRPLPLMLESALRYARRKLIH